MTDGQAIARYRYMLRTAPLEAIEEAHAEAFAALTSEQRRRVLEELKRPTAKPENFVDLSLMQELEKEKFFEKLK